MFHINFNGRFLKLFLSHFLVIMVPFSLVGAIYISSIRFNEERKCMDTLLRDTERIAGVMDNLLTTVESITIQASLNPYAGKVLNDPSNASLYDYYNVQEELKNYSWTGNLFYSIYFYSIANDRVLTTGEGFFNRKEFYDRNIIEYYISDKSHAGNYIARRLINDTQSVNVVTVSRNIPFIKSSIDGVLVFNLREDALYEVLNMYVNADREVFIYDKVGNVVSSRNKENLYKQVDGVFFQKEMFIEGNSVKIVHIKDRKYFAAVFRSSLNEWNYSCIVPYESLNKQFEGEIIILLRIAAIAVLLGLILSYVFSVKMFSPWEKLLIRVGNYITGIGMKIGSGDEYKLVDNAVENILENNRQFNEVIMQYKPIVKERFVQDLLNGSAFEYVEIKQKQEYTGIIFNFPDFIAIVVEIPGLDSVEDIKTRNDIRLAAKRIIEEGFSVECCAEGALLEEDRLGFIINFRCCSSESELHSSFKDICCSINKRLFESLGKKAYFCFGTIMSRIYEINYSFAAAVKSINYKAVSDEEDVLFSSEREGDPPYPLGIHKHIVNGIKASDTRIIEAAIEKLFEDYVFRTSYPYEKVQKIMVILVGSVLGELLQEGTNPDLLNEADAVKIIFESANARILKAALKEYFIRLLFNRERTESSREEDVAYISKVIRFMKENYDKDISLGEISAFARLNPTYLGRIFKIATGKTIMEYLNGMKIRKARELLEEGRLTVKEISLAVGYDDVHRFIRLFKKHEGVTPGEFKTSNVQK